ncbi:hypothetical protein KZP23_21970 [Echinicola marina]|uniref:hypothetical protein n=1 Tax=Echinicola marina TaxID=2859768 RepID=UPI001CF67BA0|nr:hypothetical protein [Echinicola marina]UCS93281.1 hypothetical protein KZP23_21970 [Echinicola marina]
MKSDNLNSFLNSTGFGFPESSDEIQEFRHFFKDFEFKANANKIDPSKILESTKKPTKKIDKTDYHKRTVLAAEIVYQLHQEWSLGHLKLHKLIFLCQNSLGMAIHTNFLKQAMGPYDPKLMRSIDSQLKKNQWFEYRGASTQKYWPLTKAGAHKEWYERYFHNQLEQIDKLISIFRNMKSEKVELVATIFACWQEVLEENQTFNMELLTKKFYKWSEEKKKFSESNIKVAIDWMYEKGIYPI